MDPYEREEGNRGSCAVSVSLGFSGDGAMDEVGGFTYRGGGSGWEWLEGRRRKQWLGDIREDWTEVGKVTFLTYYHLQRYIVGGGRKGLDKKADGNNLRGKGRVVTETAVR